MKFKNHQCIEVSHQYGIRRYEIASFADAAMNDEWNYEEYATIDEARDAYGDEIPAELAELLKNGPAVSIDEPGNGQRYVAAEKFDAESAACDWLAHDLNRLIVIDTTEDAKYYAEEYRGHEYAAVRAAAAEILREVEDGFIETEEK